MEPKIRAVEGGHKRGFQSERRSDKHSNANDGAGGNRRYEDAYQELLNSAKKLSDFADKLEAK